MTVDSLSELAQRRHSDSLGGQIVIEASALETLQDIAGDDGGAFMLEVVGLFLEDAADRIEDLSEAARQSDWDAVAKAAHALKSASANVGALPLAQTCAELESSVRQGVGTDLLPCHAGRVSLMFSEVQQALMRLQACFKA